MSNNHQIIISGLGGQGVLFVAKLLAGAAMAEGLPVRTSETHGMAQRGGNVISYLKLGEFSGPLIRPGRADSLIALKEESYHHHGYFLKPSGICVVNSPDRHGDAPSGVFFGDAHAAAVAGGSARSVNLVMLGFFLAAASENLPGITLEGVSRVVEGKFKGKSEGLLALLESGYNLYERSA